MLIRVLSLLDRTYAGSGKLKNVYKSRTGREIEKDTNNESTSEVSSNEPKMIHHLYLSRRFVSSYQLIYMSSSRFKDGPYWSFLSMDLNFISKLLV